MYAGLIVLLLCSLPGAAIGMLFLMLSVLLPVSFSGQAVEFFKIVQLFCLIFSFPLAAFLAGIFADKFLGGSKLKINIFSQVAICGTCYLLLSGDSFFTALEAVFSRNGTGDLTDFLSFSSHIFISSCTVSLVLMFLVMLLELPLRWIFAAGKINVEYNFSALRQVLFIFLISSGFSLIIE